MTAGNIVEAMSRFRAPRGSHVSYVSRRGLDMRVRLGRDSVRMLSDCDEADAARILAFVYGAREQVQGADYCWGIDVSGGTARMLYDAEYLACFPEIEPPRGRLMIRHGIELLGVSFIEAPTPDCCVESPCLWA